ncbi:UNVERIFIED_CONTAM: hypothetical protein Sradi_2062000 [Sesamum radiatum]|uniref:Reverse transcriptase Ty1/copia-type domain-containing protein n=1 Tax=Sesamum radiatum TaxID=300843 RepID=A0AAW2TIT8_SESRA
MDLRRGKVAEESVCKRGSERKAFISRNVLFLKKDFPSDRRRDEILLKESSEIDLKFAFLNGFIEEEIYINQPEGIISIGGLQKVCCLQKSIYSLKQASPRWKVHFDEIIRGYDFIKNESDPCVYKKISGSLVSYLVLYVNHILLIRNDVKMLADTKA